MTHSDLEKQFAGTTKVDEYLRRRHELAPSVDEAIDRARKLMGKVPVGAVIANARRADKHNDELRKQNLLDNDNRWGYWVANREVGRLFGELNGWELINLWFSLKAIGHQERVWGSPLKHRDECWAGSFYYRKNHRSIAIVYQRSLDKVRPELDAYAAKYGLRWSVPPTGSFVVVTLPDHEVIWLPEQMAAAE
jgi:hypothetical protein